jgi:hypothetical protein
MCGEKQKGNHKKKFHVISLRYRLYEKYVTHFYTLSTAQPKSGCMGANLRAGA